MEYTGMRGGRRQNAGRKKGSVNNLRNDAISVMSSVNNKDIEIMSVDMPPYNECLKNIERDGTNLGADKIFRNMYEYVCRFGCKNKVPLDLIENYALHRSRFLKCQDELSRLGYIAAHPTTKAPIASPFAALMNLFDKAQNYAFYQIYEILKSNNRNGLQEYSYRDYEMARLLDGEV